MTRLRPPEQPAMRTTIVGGRPPGSGQPCKAAPRGIEVLIKKASVDRAFKSLLLKERGAAAKAIGLTITSSEAAILQGIPAAQLTAMIRQTKVGPDLKPVFRSAAAALMLAALSATGSVGAEEAPPKSDPPAKDTPADKDDGAKSVRTPAGEPLLTPRMVCKITPPRMIAIAGVPPPGWDEPEQEIIEFPPETTPALSALTAAEARARFKELVLKLADENFDVREQATLRLMQLGQRVLPLIGELKFNDPEVLARLDRARRALEMERKAAGKLQLRDGKWEWHVER